MEKTEISTSEALGQLRSLVKLFKSLTRGEEILTKLADAEKETGDLVKSIDGLRSEKENLDLECDKVYAKRQTLLKEIESLDQDIKDKLEKASSEAGKIIDNAKQDAIAKEKVVEDRIKVLETQEKAAMKAVEKAKQARDIAEAEHEDFKQKVKDARKTLVDGMSL